MLHFTHARRVGLALTALIAAPLALVAYKTYSLGFDLADVLPRTRYQVAYEMRVDGHGEDVRVRTFLPATDEHQEITEESNASPAFFYAALSEGLNRVASWSGGSVADGARIEHTFFVLAVPMRYELAPDLEVPAEYPASIAPYLQPEPAIQVDDPAIARALVRIGADRGPLTARLRRIYDFTSSLRQRPFKGTTDALTTLRLREASCNGKSRLFVALARAAGMPARLVGGLILEAGRKRTSHQWLEVYVAGHWVPFCPTNHHFAELPERYLVLYRGDESLFRHTSDVAFQYEFVTTTTLVPSPRAKTWMAPINVWALFERLGLSFSLLRTLLMLPIGALVVVLFRNVIGLPTFGTFLPALLAASSGVTGAGWGVVGVLVVVVVVALVRLVVGRLELLHSPSLAILLTAVTTTLLCTSLAAEHFGLVSLAHIVVFPIAVLAITAERFYLALTEKTWLAAFKELGGTLVVMLACHVVMSSLALQALVIGFPEVLLLVVAANVYLGRWVGVRLTEYVRFRKVLNAARGPA
jgi:transglutaminase-like putative cysteine protease